MIQQLKDDLKQAMIAKDVHKRDILRFVLAMIKNKEIDSQKPLTDDEIIKLMQKEIKQIKETMQWLEQSWDTVWLDIEKQKIATLETYLPDMLDEDSLRKIVMEAIASLWIDEPAKNRWPLIGAIMGKYGASVDWALLNQIISRI